VAECHSGKLFLSGGEKRIGADYEPAGSQFNHLCKDSIEVTFGAGIQDVEVQPEGLSRRLRGA